MGKKLNLVISILPLPLGPLLNYYNINAGFFSDYRKLEGKKKWFLSIGVAILVFQIATGIVLGVEYSKQKQNEKFDMGTFVHEDSALFWVMISFTLIWGLAWLAGIFLGATIL